MVEYSVYSLLGRGGGKPQPSRADLLIYTCTPSPKRNGTLSTRMKSHRFPIFSLQYEEVAEGRRSLGEGLEEPPIGRNREGFAGPDQVGNVLRVEVPNHLLRPDDAEQREERERCGERGCERQRDGAGLRWWREAERQRRMHAALLEGRDAAKNKRAPGKERCDQGRRGLDAEGAEGPEDVGAILGAKA